MTLSLGSLSKDVFEQRTSTGSEAFSLFICFDANKFVLLSFFPLIKTIYPRVSTKPLPNDAKSPLPVDDRRSKTLLLKLPINHHCPPLPSIYQNYPRQLCEQPPPKCTYQNQCTVTPHFMGTRFYGQFYLSLGKACKFSLNSTCLIKTPIHGENRH